MIKAHTCHRGLAGTNSVEISLKMCNNLRGFEMFSNKSSKRDCCTTNLFKLSGGRNKVSRIDLGDLGECEGLKMNQSHLYIGRTRKIINHAYPDFSAIDNNSGDSGCLDTMTFYSVFPFASCSFNPVEFDSRMVRQAAGSQQWISASHTDAAVNCFVEDPSRLTKLTIGVCDDGATDVELIITIVSDSGYCKTGIHSRSYNVSSTELITGDQLGSCYGFEISGRTQLSFSYPSSDQICIDKIVFNEVNDLKIIINNK